MPPQQPDRLLDLFNKAFDFRAHGLSGVGEKARRGCSDRRGKAQSAWPRYPGDLDWPAARAISVPI
jgi:hypothetical protein